MYQGIRISGFGGQGVISAGVLLAQAGMMEGKEVSFFPAYGAEMRGGTANCSIVVASDEVTTPIVSTPDTAIVLNEPSLAKFEPLVKPGGLLIVNSSLVNSRATRTDIKVLYVPCNAIAGELGGARGFRGRHRRHVRGRHSQGAAQGIQETQAGSDSAERAGPEARRGVQDKLKTKK